MDLDELINLGNAILAAIIAAFADAAEDDATVVLPDRQVVVLWPPIPDCPQIAIEIDRVFAHAGDVTFEGGPALDADVARFMRGVQISVTIIRCGPEPLTAAGLDGFDTPSVEEEEDAAIPIGRDYVLVDRAIQQMLKADSAVPCNSAAFVEWTPLGNEDALVGSRQTWRLGIV